MLTFKVAEVDDVEHRVKSLWKTKVESDGSVTNAYFNGYRHNKVRNLCDCVNINGTEYQFVAKFLGTPPINIFKGKVEKGGLYIGDERIGNSELDDQEVTIGIRPEGFEVNPEANLHIVVKHVEYIGRDKSIVATNPNSEKDTFRIIIEASVDVKEGETIAVSVKPNKCFVFDKLTEKRIQ